MTLRKLYTIILYAEAAKVFSESFSFTRVEPNEEDIKGLMRLIRPSLSFDRIEWQYQRELTDVEL